MLTGSVLASFMAGFIGSRYGRRLGLLCCGAMGLVGPILQCSSSHIETLYIGRIFSGSKDETERGGRCSSQKRR